LVSDGGSLIYTTPFLANSLQSLIHSLLGVHSLLKRQSLKNNVIDRDKILVPTNWDSWGKIRILREGFDIEGVGDAWSIEIQYPPGYSEILANGNSQVRSERNTEEGTSAVVIYEQAIKDPKHDQTGVGAGGQLNGSKIEVGTEDMQPFLGKQSEILEQLKVEDEKDRAARKTSKQLDMSPNLDESRRVNEHIGPVQFNVGGIQVDADDMLRKLRVRGSHMSFL
jgi:dynein light intermediate chain 1